jgi:hypothetical protein
MHPILTLKIKCWTLLWDMVPKVRSQLPTIHN